jgi:hypothetical protein
MQGGIMKTVRYLIGFAAGLAFVSGASVAEAQNKEPESKVEEQARLARKSAGVIFGTWSLIDSPAGGTTTVEDSPLGIGYFRKGIDKHLALETTVGIWRRVVSTPASGGLGGTSGGKTTVILLPQFTSLKLFPFTGPDAMFEPFISAGAGFTLGFISQSGGGGLVGGGGGASGLVPGIGASGNAGVEWRFSNAFGLSAGGHYSYIQFFDDIAGERMYRGTGLTLGITYRFQYQ